MSHTFIIYWLTRVIDLQTPQTPSNHSFNPLNPLVDSSNVRADNQAPKLGDVPYTPNPYSEVFESLRSAHGSTFNQYWTDEEQASLERLLVAFPEEEVQRTRWLKISEALGTRTPKQVETRVQKYFTKLHKANMPLPGAGGKVDGRRSSQSYQNKLRLRFPASKSTGKGLYAYKAKFSGSNGVINEDEIPESNLPDKIHLGSSVGYKLPSLTPRCVTNHLMLVLQMRYDTHNRTALEQ